MMRLLPIAGLLGIAPALAEETARPLLKAPSVDLIQWVGALLAVLATILALAWFLRRLGGLSNLQGGRFQVLAALSLGARERVVLVQAGDKQLVLGVAPGRVQTLCILEGAETIQTAAAGETDDFRQRLAALLRGKAP